MVAVRYEFESVLVEWAARREKWVFARLPDDISEEIAHQPHPPAGFESIPVTVTIGASRWSTSIFPQSDGAYVVPLKRVIRDREGVDTGDVVRVGIEID